VNADASESGINHEGSVISKQIAKQSEAFQPEFFIMLGDNFYDTGVANVTDKLWTIDYRNLYSAPSTQVPWYAVLGNHDYYSTKPSPYTLSYTLPASLMYPPTPAHTAFAEIEYSMKKIDQRWNMPSNFYSRTFPIKGSSKTLEIVFIDTVILAPNHHNQILTALPAGNQGPAYDGSGDDANVITSTAQLQLMQPYLAWIEKTLSESTADYRIVAGHYHVYTTTNGDDTVPELVTYLVPIMKKYGVIAYINGHEHNAEVLFIDM
jgi:tartrate-resistant acid phosphatase type 5